MKEWTLTGRIVLSVTSYILSLILFINTSAFDYGDFKTSLITVNVVALIIIGIAFVLSENMLTPIFFICMGFCVPSLMAYSKLGERLFEVNVQNKFSAFSTAVLFLTVIGMLLIAGKLKKLEREYLSQVSNGADEEAIKLITINSLKVYLSFLAGTFFITFLVVVVGFVFLNIRGSTFIAIIIAVLGMALFLGCMYYLSRKWTKHSGK
ncbi:MAG: hypothetical protein GX270_04145 [Clostridiaceae bacterium]|jgi:hypothetical protein|nr:hypothetical protein [Clostridiaceae bacterium]